MSNFSASFIALGYLFGEHMFKESALVGEYVYFTKNGLPPIQLNMLKVNYTDLELSAYAAHVGEVANKFINQYNLAMKMLEKFSKESSVKK